MKIKTISFLLSEKPQKRTSSCIVRTRNPGFSLYKGTAASATVIAYLPRTIVAHLLLIYDSTT